MELNIITKQREFIRKPFDCSPMPEGNDIEILTCLFPNVKLLDWIEKNKLPYEIVDFNGMPCCVAHNDLFFYDNPRKAKSPGSKALYLARSRDKFDGLLLQYMPPDSITSKHYHEKRLETYYNLEGKCLLNIDGKDHVLEKSVVAIRPGQVHQVRTLREPALTLLDMSEGSCLSMEDHIYIKK
jgi:mannose-6-phosphate isomerase-like protein (cupin superfamily)